MQATARYIEELSEQLSYLAKGQQLDDLSYLLRMVSDEARAIADHGVDRVEAKTYREPPELQERARQIFSYRV